MGHWALGSSTASSSQINGRVRQISSKLIANSGEAYVATENDPGHRFRRARVYHGGFLAYNFLHKENCPYEGFTIIIHEHGFGEGAWSTTRIDGYWCDFLRTSRFN